MLRANKAYFKTQVNTTSQGEVVILLYDGAINFLNQAKEKIKERNFAEKGILISKAMDVINELDSSLNLEKGGDLANNLHSLYFFCRTKLLQVNLKLDLELLDKIVAILADLREAFATIVNQPEAQAAMVEAAQNLPSVPMAKGIAAANVGQAQSIATMKSSRASSMYTRRTAEVTPVYK